MKKKLTILAGTFLALICLVIQGFAQVKNEISVKINKEIDGQTKTLEKRYTSRAEMLKDPEFLEFTNGSESFVFINPSMKKAMAFEFQMDSIDFDTWEPKSGQRNIKVITTNEDEEMMWEGVETQTMVIASDRMRMDRSASVISILDVAADEFETLSTISKNEKAKFENLAVKNTERGNIMIQFNFPKDAGIEISLYNKDLKRVFSAYYESGSGLVKEEINMLQRPKGEYLLELKSDNKRWIKKLVKE